ncbi:MAG: Wzz/FepE/Etk N-terminal domain-containing protein [Gammaproteobacteria bacterium]|nr:Wzz/FepE/Etk N-terminal domain-containing protein [Gammaproteobacteria bacterium]
MGISTEEGQTYNNRNEISLVDLWFILYRRKAVFFIVVGFFLFFGVVSSFLTSTKYTYTTSIEIGSTFDQERELIDSPDVLLAKIRESYIPLVLHEHAKSGTDGGVYQISARAPSGSNIIVLESQGSEELSSTYLKLQTKIVDKVVTDHRGIVKVARLGLNGDRKKIQLKLSELQDQAKLYVKKTGRLDESAALLVKQMQEVNQLIVLSEKNRNQAITEVKGSLGAMALMVLDNETQQNRVQLAEFEERLYITLPNQRDDLKVQLANNKRAQARQGQLIEEIDVRLSNARETKAIVPPMQSLKPIGSSKKLIVFLSLVLGVLVGIFLAFFIEFVTNVRSQMKNEDMVTTSD